MNKLFVLLLMLFMHIIDDYRLQGILASMKQEKWWRENAPDSLYKNDYIMALFTHSYSWAFMIMLPIAIVNGFKVDGLFVLFLVINTVSHAAVDHLKANCHAINLICDQLIHIFQIVATWLLFICWR